VLYAAMLAVDAWTRPALEEGEGGDILAPSLETLRAFGVLSPWEVFGCGKVWLLVTPIFLHLGLIHLLFNGLSLLQLGPVAEEAFGPMRFLSIYVATGIVGNLVSAACGWGGAGASGAIFGLIGAVLVYARRRRHAIGPALLYRWLLQWLVYAAVVSLFVPRVNHLAHGAGLVSGGLLGYLADRRGGSRAWRAAARMALPTVLASFAATALAAPRVARARALVHFDEAARSGARAALDTARGRVGADEARVNLSQSIRSLDRLSGLGPEVEGFRGRFAEALRRFDGALSKGSDRSRALADLLAALEEYDRWLKANECAYGLRRIPGE
jgi:membrane associated rhomboid family serine protease